MRKFLESAKFRWGVAIFLGIFVFGFLNDKYFDIEIPAPEIFRKSSVIDREVRFSYDLFGIAVPDTIRFAGEIMPLTNKRFRRAVYRELKNRIKHKDATMVFFNRASKWLPGFAEILRFHKIPEDLKYIPIVESNLSNVVSPRGAAGFWQMVHRSARYYGLTINNEIDQRFDPWASTHAACRFLQDLKDTTGKWSLAVAGYNMGIGGIISKVNAQKKDEYFDLRFGAETGSFLPKLIALKIVLEHPRLYGFDFDPKELEQPNGYYWIHVKGPINLFHIGDQCKLSAWRIRQHNPWIKSYTISNRNNQLLSIAIPKMWNAKVKK